MSTQHTNAMTEPVNQQAIEDSAAATAAEAVPAAAAAAAVPEWPTDPSHYELVGKVGQGAFATVWRASTTESKHVCAIKVLNLDHVDSNLAEIRLEVRGDDCNDPYRV